MARGGTALIVVDTMIFAYALLGVEEFRDETVAVLEAPDAVVVPDSLRAELANVVWQWCARRALSLETGHAVLDDADALISQILPANHLWHRALEISGNVGHPVYDTLFIAAAERRDTRLVTMDRRLLSMFPALAVSPAAYLRS
jgi:predicted nucleic acid-binding protein